MIFGEHFPLARIARLEPYAQALLIILLNILRVMQLCVTFTDIEYTTDFTGNILYNPIHKNRYIFLYIYMKTFFLAHGPLLNIGPPLF